MVFSVMKRLDALGVTYYSRGKITPRTFIAGKMLCAAAGFILGLILNPPMAIVFAVPAFFYPDIRAIARNRRDNMKMLGSIRDVYDVVYLQTNAGEYITKTRAPSVTNWQPPIRASGRDLRLRL